MSADANCRNKARETMISPALIDSRINTITNIHNGDRSPLADKIDETVSVLASEIFEQIKSRIVYKDFSEAIASHKVPFYFQGRLRAEIKPYLLKMLTNENIYIPDIHIFTLLRGLLELYGIAIAGCSGLLRLLETGYLSVRQFLRRKRLLLANIWNRLWYDRTIKALKINDPVIAVHFSEGIDVGKRSDIHWFPQSRIEPDRVLLFINENSLEKKYGLFIKPNKDLLKALKASQFKWVFVPQKRLTGTGKGVWAPDRIELPGWATSLLRETVSDDIDRWISNLFEELLYEIEFWKAFLRKFNAKVLFYPGEGSTTIIAQGIAFDVLGEEGGFTAGKQRSDIGHSASFLTGYHTKDIVFTWNSRNPEYFKQPYNMVCTQIVAGYPYDANGFQHNPEIEEAKKLFDKRGVNFVVTLFDTGHGESYRNNFSSGDMEKIYRCFLNWVLDEKTLGLLIKSKKPYILEALPALQPLLKSAEETERCIRLPFRCLPSAVSKISDMVVGLNVSSAASEAVIAGCRGIHYHDKLPQTHEYYKWGYGKLVFDDLDLMMTAIKSYKADRNSNSELGDWTPYLDFIDPFRDSRAGERMGTYLRWCLEGFDSGLGRNNVIKDANSKYADIWGEDKVLEIAGMRYEKCIQ